MSYSLTDALVARLNDPDPQVRFQARGHLLTKLFKQAGELEKATGHKDPELVDNVLREFKLELNLALGFFQ